MAVRLLIPETVLKKMTSGLDGRRYDEVELVVDKDGLAMFVQRTGAQPEWTRRAYEDSLKKPVKRSLI